MIRVLHIVGPMNPGGAEQGLVRLLARVRRSDVEFAFTAYPTNPGSFDSEIRRLGGELVPTPSWRRPLAFVRSLERAFRAGRFDVVHAHHPEFAGYMLEYARRCGVRARFLHARNTRWNTTDRGFRGLLYRLYGRRRTLRAMTRGIAVSRAAANAVFGPDWQSDPRFTVIHNAVDLEPFRENHDRAVVRAELGLPAGAFVVGHVGRFKPQKNHRLLLSVLAVLKERRPEARLLLVGDGPLRPEVEVLAGQLGVRDRVVMAGRRSDVPRMLCAIDVFVLPSLHEGLPLSSVEAQAASVPCILSDRITTEGILREEDVAIVSLDAPPRRWAELCESMGRRRDPADRSGLRCVEMSDFNVDVAAATLVREYRTAVGDGQP